jgi:hypothetical protein
LALWIAIIVFFLFVVGVALLIAWASSLSPWVFRIILVLLVTALGFRLGRKVSGKRAAGTGANWTAIGFAALAAALAIYFGVVRPALRDRERDELFAHLLADGRAVTEQLESVARYTPEPAEGVSATNELQRRHLAAVQQSIAWMDRYKTDFDRFTSDQRRELHDEFHRMRESGNTARDKLNQLKGKKE